MNERDVPSGPDSPSGSPETGVSDELVEAWRRKRPDLVDRLIEVEEAVLAGLAGGDGEVEREKAIEGAREIEGFLQAFGMEHGARLANEAERLLDHPDGLEPDDVHRLSEITEALREALDDDPAVPDREAGEAGEIGLVGFPDDLAARVEAAALRRGLRTRRIAPWQLAGGALAGHPLDALVLFLDPEDERTRVLMTTGAGAEIGIPAVAISASPDLDDRVLAARLGVKRLLSFPVSAQGVLDAVEEVRAGSRGDEDARILAVDDDPMFLELTRALLEPRGVQVETLSDPERFWDALEATDPDLLLLDVQMPGLDGIELCRMVRGDLRWAHLPIIFITGTTDEERVEAIFAAGGDDYIQKPPRRAELVVRVMSRLGRARFLKRLLTRDLLTDLPNRNRFTEDLARLVSLAGREQRPLSVAAVHLDALRETNERYGPAVADRLIRKVAEELSEAAGEADAVGRGTGAEFFLAAYGATPEELAERLDGVRARLATDGVRAPSGVLLPLSLSAGLARATSGGPSAAELMEEATVAALEAVRRSAGTDVIAGEGPATGEELDVLVVEDDPVIGDLLVQALRGRRWRVRRIPHGERALEVLLDPDVLRARAVLLDVGLPGLDGFHVLQRLNEAGITRTTRVLMLTARTSEQEVLRSLDMGAFDHIPKPFSLPILLHRVERALG